MSLGTLGVFSILGLLFATPLVSLALIVGWARLLTREYGVSTYRWYALAALLYLPLLVAVGVLAIRLQTTLHPQALLEGLTVINSSSIWWLFGAVGVLAMAIPRGRAQFHKAVRLAAALLYAVNMLSSFVIALLVPADQPLNYPGAASSYVLNVILAFGFLALTFVPAQRRSWRVVLMVVVAIVLLTVVITALVMSYNVAFVD